MTAAATPIMRFRRFVYDNDDVGMKAFLVIEDDEQEEKRTWIQSTIWTQNSPTVDLDDLVERTVESGWRAES